MSEILRKPSQEVEIDHLLEEEFKCDPSFANRFVSNCGLPYKKFRVMDVAAEPSLGGEGYGDLLVEGEADGHRVALLIEDKITAGPGVRQVERYKEHAERMREDGFQEVCTILVAPESYRGERNLYDADIDLEKVRDLLGSCDERRLKHRRGIIDRALKKKATSGVQNPSLEVYRLKEAYLGYATEWCEGARFVMQFPLLRKDYHDNDAWIEHIRHKDLPSHVELRHRLWNSIKEETGWVDLIANPVDESERRLFRDMKPEWAIVNDYGRKKKGIQVSKTVPEMSQHSEFDQEAASEAIRVMKKFVEWYIANIAGKSSQKIRDGSEPIS